MPSSAPASDVSSLPRILSVPPVAILVVISAEAATRSPRLVDWLTLIVPLWRSVVPDIERSPWEVTPLSNVPPVIVKSPELQRSLPMDTDPVPDTVTVAPANAPSYPAAVLEKVPEDIVRALPASQLSLVILKMILN